MNLSDILLLNQVVGEIKQNLAVNLKASADFHMQDKKNSIFDRRDRKRRSPADIRHTEFHFEIHRFQLFKIFFLLVKGS